MIIQAELKCKQAGCEAEPCAVDRAIYISPVPTIRTVKGRVVFFRAQHKKSPLLTP